MQRQWKQFPERERMPKQVYSRKALPMAKVSWFVTAMHYQARCFSLHDVCLDLICGIDEVANQCGKLCEATCSNRNPVCPAVCTQPACKCRVTFVRQNNVCVPETTCPRSASCKPRMISFVLIHSVVPGANPSCYNIIQSMSTIPISLLP